ncbi:DUF2332 domain-containing protein [Nocardia gamkensis]|uniref:DUF2332 domain-containing protein n=1 Tax=Nocardia gamkensis TaxID=352869 RepID=UPI0033CE45A9
MKSEHALAQLEVMRQRLLFFARSTVSRSPLYSALSTRVAEDDEILELLTAADGKDADAPLFFAAAQYLLRSAPRHRLAEYYPTLGGEKTADEKTWPAFRDFVTARSDAMLDLMRTRYVQTNEVRRAAVLHPAIASICALIGEPVALVEVGCSAGLLLAMENFRIRYRFEDGRVAIVQPEAPIRIDCPVTGVGFAPSTRPLSLAERIGLDRAPIDPSVDDPTWLESCVWADQPDRLALLRRALAVPPRVPVTFVQGDAIGGIRAALSRLPATRPVIVVTSWMVLYLADHQRTEFVAELGNLAAGRPLWWIDNGPYEDLVRVLPSGSDRGDADLAYAETGHGTLAIIDWNAGTPHPTVLATSEPHGASMRWLGRNGNEH